MICSTLQKEVCAQQNIPAKCLFFFISNNFTFSPMNDLLYVDKDLGIHKLKNTKVAGKGNEKNCMGFLILHKI